MQTKNCAGFAAVISDGHHFSRNVNGPANAFGSGSSLELGRSRVGFGPSAAHYFTTCQLIMVKG